MNIKGVAQRGKNTYRFTVSCGFDGKGKQIRHTMTFKVPEGTAPSKAEKAISEHLGHCNTAITSDIYTHIFKEYKAKMAESIEKDLI